MNQEKCRAAIEDLKARAKRREDSLLTDFALLLEELIWPSEADEPMAAPPEAAPPGAPAEPLAPEPLPPVEEPLAPPPPVEEAAPIVES